MQMNSTRKQLMIAGALVALTGLAGAAARGTSNGAAAPPGAIRTSFAAPAHDTVSFTGQLDRTSVLAGHDGLVRMEVVMSAKPEEVIRRTRRPTDVVIILDRSGSMANDKIEHARAA